MNYLESPCNHVTLTTPIGRPSAIAWVEIETLKLSEKKKNSEIRLQLGKDDKMCASFGGTPMCVSISCERDALPIVL